jgi:hypothetical protein
MRQYGETFKSLNFTFFLLVLRQFFSRTPAQRHKNLLASLAVAASRLAMTTGRALAA